MCGLAKTVKTLRHGDVCEMKVNAKQVQFGGVDEIVRGVLLKTYFFILVFYLLHKSTYMCISCCSSLPYNALCVLQLLHLKQKLS